MADKADAARMIIGPLSDRQDLLDATDDVVHELLRLRRTREALILAGDALRAEKVALLRLLADVQWGVRNEAETSECPVCRSMESQGHDDECELADVLR